MAVAALHTCVQALVLDDNRANAALALAFNNTACTYRFQQPQAFYECRLVQLQWWRAQNSLRCVLVAGRISRQLFQAPLVASRWSSDCLSLLPICPLRRLYFDARGEGDLRLPMESSIAVIKLKDDSAATAAAEACSRSCSTDPAAGPTPVGRVCSGSFDLDAMGTRLLVLSPDACQTFIQKPGHYKVSDTPSLPPGPSVYGVAHGQHQCDHLHACSLPDHCWGAFIWQVCLL